MYFIVYFICIFAYTSCEEDKTSYNFEPASIIYNLYLYTCMWLYIWSCGHADNIPDFQSEDCAGHGIEFRCGQEHFVLYFLPATVK